MLRNEHPNPQFKRDSFICLNGEWKFYKGKYGENDRPHSFDKRIIVPFCPESTLSGIGDTSLITDCVYSREVELTNGDLQSRLVLHFGAVDYFAAVYVNGKKACEHIGGYTAFEVDVSPFVNVGKNIITVAVHDDVREDTPSGKQSKRENSHGCFYTRSTGIWQTVWLEKTPDKFIKSVKFFTRRDFKSVDVELRTSDCGEAAIKVFFEGKLVGAASGSVDYRNTINVALSETHLWEIGKGNLYDVEITFGQDKVESYFGLRDVKYEGRRFLLNGKSVFQRLVLDQGYYEDGVYTAKSADSFADDIRLSMSLGFNGARLHQKVFEQRFLYECDKAGYITWGEFPSWGMRYDNLNSLGVFAAQWSETVEQYFNHPSIITWCPLNEVWEDLDNNKLVRDVRFVEAVYLMTKALDGTRPCVDASGGYHGKYTDVFDFHNYHLSDKTVRYVEDIQSKDVLSMDKTYAPDFACEHIPYDGKLPLIASEYGGIKICDGKNGCWGYHSVASEDDFVKEYIAATNAYLSCDKICGFCYTQLYDVEQEQNGLYNYLREKKLSDDAIAKIRACNLQVAAIEKQ